ncbi:MAG TPA: carbohydrate ABC transporter permease [Lachnospiraceae bacterium]|nr:carbohydrate ABC transporter permease [Lachnospiraceae bacterium]
MRKRILHLLTKYTSHLVVLMGALLILMPLWMMLTGSFMSKEEVASNLSPVLNGGSMMASWPIFPKYITMQPYVQLLLDSPTFFVMIWNSFKQVFPILFGQLLIGVPAAWAFGRYQFRGRKLLITMYTILMIMPFQVTMVSSYIVLDRMKLINTHLAIIVPAVLSTFPIFIMMKFVAAIPKSLFEAAQIDGAGEGRIFITIGIPMSYSGIISALILSFLEYWNALEQPLTFLSDKSKWPLSLYLPNIAVEKVGVSLVASVIMMLPALLLFLYGQGYLEEGICASGIKE